MCSMIFRSFALIVLAHLLVIPVYGLTRLGGWVDWRWLLVLPQIRVPEARALLDACDEVLKSALYVRDPLPTWSAGTRTLSKNTA